MKILYGEIWKELYFTRVVELVVTSDLESDIERCVGSSPTLGTKLKTKSCTSKNQIC